MKLTRDVLNRKDLVIYGAGSYGELALMGLKQLGLEPLFFIDRGRNEDSYFGYSVIKPDNIEEYINKTILIATADYYYEVYLFLEEAGCERIYDISYLLDLKLDTKSMSNRTRDKYDSKITYMNVVKSTDLTLVHVGYCVTERCSLRCKDCSFLMQYYKEPEDIDLSLYREAFDRFLDTIDRICELRIYGGEPFMNPEWYRMVEWYVDCKKIEQISVYTNGTIIPREETLVYLKNDKVKVHISNYIINYEKIEKLVELLKQNNIRYFVRTCDEWVCGGDFELRDNNEQRLSERYGNCYLRTSGHFYRGRYYTCARVAHAENLEGIVANIGDSVDFNEDLPTEELKNMMTHLLHDTPYLEACRFCPGMDVYGERVKAGLQAKKPIEFDMVRNRE